MCLSITFRWGQFVWSYVAKVMNRSRLEQTLADIGFARGLGEHWDTPRDCDPIVFDELERLAEELGPDMASRVRVDSCRCRYGDVDMTLLPLEGADMDRRRIEDAERCLNDRIAARLHDGPDDVCAR